MQSTKIIAMACLYLVGALGLHVQINLCCGHFAGFEWNWSQDGDSLPMDNCCKKENCCSTILVDASIDDEHVVSKGLPSLVLSMAAVANLCANLEWTTSSMLVNPIVKSYNGPPPLSGKNKVCLYHHWKTDIWS
jgi:hypothetical protein